MAAIRTAYPQQPHGVADPHTAAALARVQGAKEAWGASSDPQVSRSSSLGGRGQPPALAALAAGTSLGAASMPRSYTVLRSPEQAALIGHSRSGSGSGSSSAAEALARLQRVIAPQTAGTGEPVLPATAAPLLSPSSPANHPRTAAAPKRMSKQAQSAGAGDAVQPGSGRSQSRQGARPLAPWEGGTDGVWEDEAGVLETMQGDPRVSVHEEDAGWGAISPIRSLHSARSVGIAVTAPHAQHTQHSRRSGSSTARGMLSSPPSISNTSSCNTRIVPMLRSLSGPIEATEARCAPAMPRQASVLPGVPDFVGINSGRLQVRSMQ